MLSGLQSKSSNAEAGSEGKNVFLESKFLWVKEIKHQRNQFVRFVREFDWENTGEAFPLYLFADTRYRLRVNGEFLAAGPGRFVTQYPEFDTLELSGFLKEGANRIEVEVNFYGASSFQSMPDGKPGFIAAGGGRGVDLATPGEWKAYWLDAWRWDAPLYSFAQNPVEICDTRKLSEGAAATVCEVSGEDMPWGELRPYSGAPVPFHRHNPEKIEVAGKLQNEEFRIGFMVNDSGIASRVAPQKRPFSGFATWVFSPREQQVPLSCFWGDHFCNGEPLAVDFSGPCGNHGLTQLNLKEGWNFLTGKFEVMSEFWALCLGVPKTAELSFHGERNQECREAFSICSPMEKDEICLPQVGGDGKAPAGWSLHGGDASQITPARMMAWDVLSSKNRRGLEYRDLAEVAVAKVDAGSGAVWCFSFQGEFLGHIVIDVEAPVGTVMDVASDDWQRADGAVALYQSNPFIDAADRFILKGGKQRVELYHPRGGKLIQVTMRSGQDGAEMVLRDIFVRSRHTFGPDESKLVSGNTVLDWSWPVAMRTLRTSADESYADCPWRERGAYIADCWVNLHLNFLLTRDLRTARRSLRIFAQAQREDGHLANCAPAWLRNSLHDFTLIWMMMLHDYWAGTGDVEMLEEMWPTVIRIWDSPAWEVGTDGLWKGPGKFLFVDWGVLVSEREGDANGILNLFRLGAAKACAKMAKVLGREGDAARFEEEVAKVDGAVYQHLWDHENGRLFPSLGATTSALHANVLALAFGWSTAENRNAILRYLEPFLCENRKAGIQNGQFSGHLELYFLFYTLLALGEHGRVDLAETLIDDIYGYLQSLGDDTFPESFCNVEQGGGSRCHSWSGGAAIYAARNVLGLRQREAGNPDEWIFAPRVNKINGASGKVAHRLGWIEIAWERKDGKPELLRVDLPKGVALFRADGSKI